MYAFLAYLLTCLLVSSTGMGQQFNVLYPTAGTVFQRTPVSANVRFVVCSQEASSGVVTVQMRFRQRTIPGNTLTNPVDPRPSGGSVTADGWISVVAERSPIFNQYFANVDIRGGVYVVELRSGQGGNIFTLTNLGVGEVFIIAGQSNAAGYSKDGEDSYVTNVSPFFQFINDKDVFEENDPGSNRNGTKDKNFLWYWGGLGNRLIDALGVPVTFYQTAFSSTSVSEWIKSANGEITRFQPNGATPGVPGYPYKNLAKILTGKARLTGVRAVLWMQGEADYGRSAQYATDLNDLIRFTRTNGNGLGNGTNDGNGLAWVVARTSRINGMTDAGVIAAQNQVIGNGKVFGDPTRTPAGLLNVFAGPETDNSPRISDLTHLNRQGQEEVANAWFTALTQASGNGQNFFTNSGASARATTPDFDQCYIITGTGDCNIAIGVERSGGTSCGQSVTLRATCQGSDCAGTTYTWSGQGLNASGATVTFNLPNSNGEFVYTLTASKSGCYGKRTTTTYNLSNCGTTPSTCTINTPVRIGTWNGYTVQVRQFGSKVALVVVTDASNDTHFPRGDNFWNSIQRDGGVDSYQSCLNAGSSGYGGLAFPDGIATPSGYSDGYTGDGAHYFVRSSSNPNPDPCTINNPVRIGTWNNYLVQIRSFSGNKRALVVVTDASNDTHFPRGDNFWNSIQRDGGVDSYQSCLNAGSSGYGGLAFPDGIATPSGYSDGYTGDGAHYFVRLSSNPNPPTNPPTGSNSIVLSVNCGSNTLNISGYLASNNRINIHVLKDGNIVSVVSDLQGPSFNQTVSINGSGSYFARAMEVNNDNNQVNSANTSVNCSSARLASEETSTTVQVYPNPTVDKVTIRYFQKTDGVAKLRILSPSGNVFLQRDYSGKAGLNDIDVYLNESAAGSKMVLLEMQIDAQRIVQKILKQQ